MKTRVKEGIKSNTHEPEPDGEADGLRDQPKESADFQELPWIPASVESTGGAEPVCEDAPYPHYKPGVYQTRCIAADFYRDPRFGRWVVALKFMLVPNGGTVYAFLNLGSDKKARVARGSEYRRVWIMANGEQPRKRQVLSRKVFLNKIFRVRIGDVTKRHDGRKHLNAEIYSTVKEILAKVWP